MRQLYYRLRTYKEKGTRHSAWLKKRKNINLKKYKLEIIVFISGAIVMILELIGSRVFAPYLGASIYVWTSLIGVILGALSLGYAWGGRLADRSANYKILSVIFLFASATILFAAFFDLPILSFLQSLAIDLRLKSALGALILLGPASVFLGMVTPYAIRLKLRDVVTSGQTVGNLYAISTIGSILGTFLAGFVLISVLGTTKILLTLSAISLFLAILAEPKYLRFIKLIGAGIIVICFWVTGASAKESAAKGIIDTDSSYNRIQILHAGESTSGRVARLLIVNGERDSGLFIDNPKELIFEYIKMYRLVKHFVPGVRRALMIGGGAYTYPRDFLRSNPDAEIDVVEIDPKITELAQQYFGLKDDPRLHIYHEDGRTFINTATKHYDVIFGDAFKSFSIPFQLTTVEAVGRMHDLLNEEGAVIVNAISSIDGEGSKFLRAEYRTFKQLFPQVYVFIPGSKSSDQVQNIIIVALKSDKKPILKSADQELSVYLSRLWNKEIAYDLPILTDDYAPVEQYMPQSAHTP